MKENIIKAKVYNSNFKLSHDTYNGMHAASDGLIYYVLCSQSIDEGGKMYSFNPQTEEILLCGDLTEACGEKDLKTIPQGKSHVNFTESDGKLFFSTHIGYYSIVEGMEKMGIPPEGYLPYPGGHLLSFDLKTKKFKDYTIAPHKEGVLTMSMDTQRNIIYGITWPSGYFFKYAVDTGKMTDFGKISMDGENGKEGRFRSLCRSIAIDPDSGKAYFSVSEGTILYYNPDTDQICSVTADNLKKDYFGVYDLATPGHMGYNWRQVFWYAPHKCIYGVHGNSGYFFRFDPHTQKLEVLDRITSKASQQSGMYDQFSYGYLGLTLAPDQRTVYYLTGSPLFINGHRVPGKSNTARGEAKGLENLNLVTYDLLTHRYQDHGSIYFDDGSIPLYVNSIALGGDRHVYSLARVNGMEGVRTELIQIPDPYAVKRE